MIATVDEVVEVRLGGAADRCTSSAEPRQQPQAGGQRAQPAAASEAGQAEQRAERQHDVQHLGGRAQHSP
jgi:hypothetical protein